MVDPKQISVVFKSEEQNKKKGKKWSSPLYITFPTSISNIPPSLLQFSIFFFQFSCYFFHFSPLFIFFLPFFSQSVSENFPVRSLGGGGGHSAQLPPPPTCYVTLFDITWQPQGWKFMKMSSSNWKNFSSSFPHNLWIITTDNCPVLLWRVTYYTNPSKSDPLLKEMLNRMCKKKKKNPLGK